MTDRLGLHVPRAAFAAASLAATAVLMLGIVGAFHQASSLPWLRDTPLARSAVARCEALTMRSERRDCLEAVAIAARERDAGTRWQAAAASATVAEPRAQR